MINNFLKGIVDLFYQTNSKRKNYERNNPTEKVLAADGTKGIKTKNQDEIKRGPEWIAAQRAVVMLTQDRIICGKWSISLDKIQQSDLVIVKTILGSGQILKISTTDGDNFQFGMQFNPEWSNQNTLKLNIQNGKVKTSLFSWVLRIGLIAYLIYLFFIK